MDPGDKKDVELHENMNGKISIFKFNWLKMFVQNIQMDEDDGYVASARTAQWENDRYSNEFARNVFR